MAVRLRRGLRSAAPSRQQRIGLLHRCAPRQRGGGPAAAQRLDQRHAGQQTALLHRQRRWNPAENVWEYLRGRWLSNHIFDDYDAILDAICDAICDAWNRLIAEPARIHSIGSRQWALSGEA